MIRIVSDSSSNLPSLKGCDYHTVPLTVQVGDTEYPDVAGADPAAMFAQLHQDKATSSTSCPSLHAWLSAFAGAQEAFGITISSGLSASHETALMAAKEIANTNPSADIRIIDSLATGPVMRLLIEKIVELDQRGETFDTIDAEVRTYLDKTKILYALKSLNNLARNGRVNAHVAKIAGALNIGIIGHASSKGTVELLHTCKGERRTLKTVLKEMHANGFKGGKVRIDHANNLAAATSLSEMILADVPESDVQIGECTILCSYYADEGGLIVGYETA